MFNNKRNVSTQGSAEDIFVQKAIERVFTQKKAPAGLPKKGSSVVLLLSGGLDSTSLWFYLLNHFQYDVYPLFIKRSEKDSQQQSVTNYEQIFAKQFPGIFKPVKTVLAGQIFSFRTVDVKNITTNAEFVVSNSVKTPDSERYNLWYTATPTRLTHYLAHASDYMLTLRYKNSIDVHSLFLGLVPEDTLSRESTATVLSSYNLAICATLGDYSVRIHAPFQKKSELSMNRQSLLKYALDRGVDLSKTWSCVYYDRKIPCNVCISCVNRARILQNKTGKTRKLKTMLKNTLQQSQRFVQALSIQKVHLPDQGIVSIASDIKEVNSGRKLFLVTKKAELVELNTVAQFLWNTVKKKPISCINLLQLIENRYEYKSSDTLQKDIKEFLSVCIQNKLMKIVSQ